MYSKRDIGNDISTRVYSRDFNVFILNYKDCLFFDGDCVLRSFDHFISSALFLSDHLGC